MLSYHFKTIYHNTPLFKWSQVKQMVEIWPLIALGVLPGVLLPVTYAVWMIFTKDYRFNRKGLHLWERMDLCKPYGLKLIMISPPKPMPELQGTYNLMKAAEKKKRQQELRKSAES